MLGGSAIVVTTRMQTDKKSLVRLSARKTNSLGRAVVDDSVDMGNGNMSREIAVTSVMGITSVKIKTFRDCCYSQGAVTCATTWRETPWCRHGHLPFGVYTVPSMRFPTQQRFRTVVS